MENVDFQARRAMRHGLSLAYNWNFSDGTTGSGKMTSHTYAIPGPYRVQLTLITVQGDPSITKALTVLPGIPQKIVQTIFQKINVTAFATFMINGTAKILTGMASVTAVNTTSGAMILFKNFSISVSFGNAIMTSFILAEGQTLSIDCSLNVTTGVASCLVSRDLDLDHDGRVDVLDASMIGAAWQSTPASPTWNPAADLNADGKVDILDVSLFGAFWQTRAFT